jgi:hypothetical protein
MVALFLIVPRLEGRIGITNLSCSTMGVYPQAAYRHNLHWMGAALTATIGGSRNSGYPARSSRAAPTSVPTAIACATAPLLAVPQMIDTGMSQIGFRCVVRDLTT